VEQAGNSVEIAPGISVHADVLQWRYVRARGPGGQNVNKVSTAAELRVRLADLNLPGPAALDRLRSAAGSRVVGEGELLLFCDEHRTQERNRAELLERLRELMITALAEPRRRKKTRPGRGAVQRRIDGKKRRGEVKRGRSNAIE
jgi:ribosome-associated protein